MIVFSVYMLIGYACHIWNWEHPEAPDMALGVIFWPVYLLKRIMT